MDDTGLPYLPGTSTVSEMLAVAEHGHTAMKFFPAEAAGGAPYLASLASPLPTLRFCPTGGITRGAARQLPAAAERRLRRRLLAHPGRRGRNCVIQPARWPKIAAGNLRNKAAAGARKPDIDLGANINSEAGIAQCPFDILRLGKRSLPQFPSTRMSIQSLAHRGGRLRQRYAEAFQLVRTQICVFGARSVRHPRRRRDGWC